MKEFNPVNAIAFTILVFQIIVFVESYDFKCPSQGNWKIRAQVKCNSTVKYVCLYNNVDEIYVEGCNGPDWDRKGSKRIFSGSFNRGHCTQTRYQPFYFQTNESMSDCIYAKSFCKTEGQTVYADYSAKYDTTCRCDNKNNYVFIKSPKNLCYCTPTEEDCSCYLKSCHVNLILSEDYKCIKNDDQTNPKCIDTNRYNATVNKDRWLHKGKTHWWMIGSVTVSTFKFGDPIAATILIILCLVYIFVAGRFVLADSLDQAAKLTTTDINFLRIVHLLFRVAFPVVQMLSNYRQRKGLVDEVQWDLLLKGIKDNMKDLDIRHMILLLRTLANIGVDDVYPATGEDNIGLQLPKIENITQSFDGTLSDHTFNQYWNEIRQAVFYLVSSNIHELEKDKDMKEEDKKLVDRLIRLNPIKIDHTTLCKFIDMSEKYPATILKQCIHEYCTTKDTSIKKILTKARRSLYNKRTNSESYSIFPTQISIKQWEALYEIKEDYTSHSSSSEAECGKTRSVPKEIDMNDLSVTLTLVLHIPAILRYVIQSSCTSGFDSFLMKNKHKLYHVMKTERCCECFTDATEKILLNKREWDKLYMKKESIPCKKGIKDCCCQYSVRGETKYLKMDEKVLSKIFYVTGPLCIFNKILEDPFLHFLNWTIDEKPLQNAVTELLSILCTKAFRIGIMHLLDRSNPITVYHKYTREWVSSYLQHEKATTGQRIQIIVHDEDGLNVKSVKIPQDFPLRNGTSTLTDLSAEENNFLVVVYGLTNIAYPMIEKEFSEKCSNKELEQYHMDAHTQSELENSNDDIKYREDMMCLTQKHQQDLLTPEKEDRKKLSLESMIKILKQRTKKKGKKTQLDSIDIIRREVFQIHKTGSGVLDNSTFQDNMNRIQKAVVHLGGKQYEKKLLHIQHIKDILEINEKEQEQV